MNPILKNVIAVILGIVVGSAVNMTLITISSSVIPLPEGVDPGDMNSLIENMSRFEAKHFLMPFLAHALGTFVGALLAAAIAATHKMKFALGIGGFFMLGGIANVFLLPAPMWFNAVDILFAYIPMAYFASKIVVRGGNA